MTVEKFGEAFPRGVYLEPGDAAGAAAVLSRAGLGGEVQEVEPAGEGNMNLVLRAFTTEGSVVIKQSRPWVEKYPGIAAPPERHAVEAAFYRAVSGVAGPAGAMPRFLGGAPESGAIVLEDLGGVRDLTDRYDGPPLEHGEAEFVLTYLRELHQLEVRDGPLRNRSMRRLNHEHIFDIPLRGSGGPDLGAITPGLTEEAEVLRRDARLGPACRRLGQIYLADGRALLHGDIHPGSVLVSGAGLRVIDPEFAFGGPVEFDLGVLVAHAMLTGWEREEAIGLLDLYAPRSAAVDRPLVEAFAGVEIVRRLIGVAQLPLRAHLDRKRAWLGEAREMVLRWA